MRSRYMHPNLRNEWAERSAPGLRRAMRWLPALVMALGLMLGSGAWAAEPQVKFVTNEGDFVVELYPEKAPKTVANFLQYVRAGFYDGTIFHRVIAGFMIQGGGYDQHYVEKPARAPIVDEAQEASAQGLRNIAGTIAMARTDDPDSATSQFFINVADNKALDPVAVPPGDPVPVFEYMGRVYHNVPRAELVGNPRLAGYAVFGKVVSGMAAVEKISHLKTGAGGPFPTDVPQTMVVIQSARIVHP